MASRTILAGIKTSAIMNVATATLAALLALVAQLSFEALDRLIIPRGLRLPQREP
jgi:hypothetical protein